MSDATAQTSLRHLARYVERQYNNAPIILLDEYDSPLHEAWVTAHTPPVRKKLDFPVDKR